MNIKEKLIQVGFVILVVIFLIAVVLIFLGLNASTINWMLVKIGIIVLIPYGIYFLYHHINFSKNIQEDTYNERIKKLKQTADRVVIDLDKVVITESNHFQTNTIVTGKAAALNEISGHGHHNEETIKHTSCEVKFKIKHHKKRRTIETTIHKDETSVRMYFYMQKETVVYIDPYDPEHYYIDLEFIEN